MGRWDQRGWGERGRGDWERRLGSGAGAGLAVFGGKEGFGEGGIEVVAAIEVFEGVAFIAAEVTDFDEIVDDVADVETTVEAPLVEEGERHGAELFDDVVAETGEKFLAGDVLIFLALAEHFGGVFEGDADEVVGFWTVAVITLDGVVDGLGEQRGHWGRKDGEIRTKGAGNVAQSWRGSMEEARWRKGRIFCFRLVKFVFWSKIADFFLILPCILKAPPPTRLV